MCRASVLKVQLCSKRPVTFKRTVERLKKVSSVTFKLHFFGFFVFLFPFLGDSQSLLVDTDFSDSANLHQSLYFETSEPYSFTISDSVSRDGNPSGRFELRYGDRKEGGSTRSEISFNRLHSEEIWVGFSLYLPKSWTPDTEAEITGQIHTFDTLNRKADINPPVVIENKNGLTICKYRYSLSETPPDGKITIIDTLGPTITGKWVDYVIHTKYGLQNGTVQVWQNGTLAVNYSGPVGYKHCRPPFAKFGIYKWSWSEKGPSDVTRRIAYYDDIKIAGNGGTYALVAPPPKKVNQRPIASVKKNEIAITLPKDSVTLDGSPSKDDDGKIVSYQWKQTSSPSDAAIADKNSLKTKVTELQEGIYLFNLIVKDNNGAMDTAELKVIVHPKPNKPPIAEVKNEKLTIRLPKDSVIIDGSPSKDNDGKIVSYKWEQKSGPSAAYIVSPDSVQTKVHGLQEGNYSFQLTATDNDNESSIAQVTVKVNPVPNDVPMADVKKKEIEVSLSEDSAILDGSPSKDNDGRIVSYQWEQESGPSASIIIDANAEKTSVTGFEAGIYVFQLTVKDDNGATSTSKMTITVRPPPNKPPVAKVKNSELTITLPKDSVTLDGSGSTDNDGKITSYKWKQQLGPSSATITDPSAAQTEIKGLKEGAYVFNLAVKDNDGAASTSKVTITVNPAPNKPPIAQVKEKKITITLPEDLATFDGSLSKDSDGKIVSYKWKQQSGPSTSAITDPNAAKTKVTGLKEGKYVFNLTVKDDKGATSTSKVTLTVNPIPNKPPVAKVKNNELTITLPKDSAILDGSESTDSDGKITSYQWKQKSGPSASVIADPNAVQTKVTGLKEGIYVFNLIIKDNDDETDAAKVTVTVNPKPNQLPVTGSENSNVAATPPNKPPIAEVKDEKITIILPEDSVTLDGSPSTDNDGKIISWQWKQKSGPSNAAISDAVSAQTEIKGLKEGIYVFNLIIKDNDGETDAAKVTVAVNPKPNQPPVTGSENSNVAATPPNKPPVAKVKDEKITITLPEDSVTLDGSGSTDSDGKIVSYNWKQQSGPSASTIADLNAAKTKVTGLKKGKYVFNLTVKDDKEATSTSKVTLTVNLNPTPNKPPLAKIKNNALTVTLPEDSVILDGSQSTDNDGEIISYHWKQKSGPSSVTIIDTKAVKTKVKGLKEGRYVFHLIVKDNDKAKDTAKITVAVKPAPDEAPAIEGVWPEENSSLTILGEIQDSIINQTTENTDQIFPIQSLIVYPNPASKIIYVRFYNPHTGKIRITIYDESGRVRQKQYLYKDEEDFNQKINISRLANGIYFIQIQIGQYISTRRVIKIQ